MSRRAREYFVPPSRAGRLRIDYVREGRYALTALRVAGRELTRARVIVARPREGRAAAAASTAEGEEEEAAPAGQRPQMVACTSTWIALLCARMRVCLSLSSSPSLYVVVVVAVAVGGGVAADAVASAAHSNCSRVLECGPKGGGRDKFAKQKQKTLFFARPLARPLCLAARES